MSELPSMKNVFDEAKAAISPSLPRGSWYIITCDSFGDLYEYVIADLGAQSKTTERRRIVSRLREVMVKSWTLVGVPSVIAAWYSLRRVVKPEDLINNDARQKLAASPKVRLARTHKWYQQVFGEEEEQIFARFDTFPEFEWTLKDVVYGSFLSDLSILSAIENEIVVLACVTGQGAGSPVLTHYRGLRRVGASALEVKSVEKVMKIVATGLEIDVSRWHTPEEAGGLE